MRATKLEHLRRAWSAGDLAGALRIAARFPDLGSHRAEIQRAHEAMLRPDFLRQIGRDPQACIEAGRQALAARYRLS